MPHTRSLLRWGLAFCLVFVFIGCATSPEERTEQSAGFTTYEGPVLTQTYSTPSESGTLEYALYALTPKTGPSRFFAVVSNAYEGHWRQYLRAVDSDGNRYEALSTLNHPRCELFCDYEDRIEYEIPSQLLRSHARKGLSFTLEGPSQDPSPSFSFNSDYLQHLLTNAR
jgi:hypothetical protein